MKIWLMAAPPPPHAVRFPGELSESSGTRMINDNFSWIVSAEKLAESSTSRHEQSFSASGSQCSMAALIWHSCQSAEIYTFVRFFITNEHRPQGSSKTKRNFLFSKFSVFWIFFWSRRISNAIETGNGDGRGRIFRKTNKEKSQREKIFISDNRKLVFELFLWKSN